MRMGRKKNYHTYCCEEYKVKTHIPYDPITVIIYHRKFLTCIKERKYKKVHCSSIWNKEKKHTLNVRMKEQIVVKSYYEIILPLIRNSETKN